MRWPFSRKASAANSVYERLLHLLGDAHRSKAGPEVNLETAVRVGAAFACMQRLSLGVASTPFKLFQEAEGANGRTINPARDHALYDVITSRPNAWQTSFEFIEQLVLHACLGNAYVFKNSYREQVAEVFLLNPGRVKAEQQEDWSTRYWITDKAGQQREIPAENIWHLRGTSWDGFLGLDTLKLARDVLGLSIAVDDSLSALHRNGVRPSGAYVVEGALDKKGYDDLTAYLKKMAAADAAGTPLILDRSAKWVSSVMTSVDAQVREIRNDLIPDVCRFFNMMPIMIGFTGDKANTYASAEAMFTAHKVFTLSPWYIRIAQSADVNILSDADRRAGYYTKFLANGLMYANSKDQGEYFTKALGSGGAPAWLTQDEVRALIELNPMGGAASRLPVATNVPSTSPAPSPAGA